MNPTICLATNGTLRWPKAAGLLWVFLNWALGLRALGCRVLWLERITADLRANEVPNLILNLRRCLEAYGLENCLALSWETKASLPSDILDGCLTFEEARDADLLLNLAYDIPTVELFRRSAFVDIDPGLTQIWIDVYNMKIGRHDTYFGTLVNAWLARGGRAFAAGIGTDYVDVGTLHGWRDAARLVDGRADASAPRPYRAAITVDRPAAGAPPAAGAQGRPGAPLHRVTARRIG